MVAVPRTAERPSKLQLLQQFSVAGFGDGKAIRSDKDQAVYVGITNPTNRSGMDEKSGDKTEENEKKGTVVRWVSGQYYYSFGLASDGDWAPNSQMGNRMVKREVAK